MESKANENLLTKQGIKEKVHNFLIKSTAQEQVEYLVATLLFLMDDEKLSSENDCIKKIEKDYDFSFSCEVVKTAKKRILTENAKQRTKE